MMEKFQGRSGYILRSVLFLVTVISVLCVPILKMRLVQRGTALEIIEKVELHSAQTNLEGSSQLFPDIISLDQGPLPTGGNSSKL